MLVATRKYLPRNGKSRSVRATISPQSRQCGIHRKSRAKLSKRKKSALAGR
jgi:hypothetical protein